MYRVWDFVTTYSILLISGALIALVWANVDAESYRYVIGYPLWFNTIVGADAGQWLQSYGPAYGIDELGDVTRVLSVHSLVNDMLMAFFFAIAAKEVWEAVVLKNGSLRGRKAATPLVATAGGIAGPVVVYLGLAAVLGSDTYDALARGWAIPTATDIAFSYLIGRLVFGAGHPAVRFLLLLAIADDAAGLIILAVFYPTADVVPAWLLLSLASAVGVYVLFNWLPRAMDRGNQLRPTSTWVRERLSFWPYLVAGVLSWYGFQEAGLHPALGLLPIVPTLPHADRAFGIFAEAETFLTDLLNHCAHLLKRPVEIVLFLFGLVNAGVEVAAIGAPTGLVLAGLIVGKPFGILLFGWLAAAPMRLGLPAGMRTADLFVVGCAAGIGFTVPIFIASVAFDSGPVQDAAKMGALLSVVAAALSVAAGKALRVKRRPG